MKRATRLRVTTETPGGPWKPLPVAVNVGRTVTVDVDGKTFAALELTESADGAVGVHVTIYEHGDGAKWRRSSSMGSKDGGNSTTQSLRFAPKDVR